LGVYFFPCDARCTGSRQGGDRRQPCSIHLSSAGRGSNEVTSAGEWIHHVKGRFRFIFIRFPYRRRVFSPSPPAPASSPSCFSLLEISQDDGEEEKRDKKQGQAPILLSQKKNQKSRSGKLSSSWKADIMS
jgi:hypothetical protein